MKTLKCVKENKVWQMNKLYSYQIVDGFYIIEKEATNLQERLWSNGYTKQQIEKYFIFI